MSVVAAAVLFTGVLAYAVLGGADYGAGDEADVPYGPSRARTDAPA